MKSQALRWMTCGFGVVALAGVLTAQTVGGSMTREGFGSLGGGSTEGTRGSSVSGPTLGYVVDASTGNLHMVSGIAGSSLMGPAVHRGSSIRISAIAPSAGYAVVVDESGTGWFYGEAGPRGAGGVELAEFAGATHLATSPSGDAVAAFAASTGRISIYEVSAGVARHLRSYTVSVPAEVTRLALADSLKDPVLLARDGAGSSVLRAGNDGVKSLAALPGASDLVFFRGSEKALVLDGVQNALYETDLSAQNPVLSLVASSGQGIEQPVGLALSEDNRTAAVASAGNRKASLIDLATRAAVLVDLPETPSGIRRMNSRAVFQLTDASSSPMLLLDVQGNSARTVYVPRAEGGRGAASGRASLQ